MPRLRPIVIVATLACAAMISFIAACTQSASQSRTSVMTRQYEYAEAPAPSARAYGIRPPTLVQPSPPTSRAAPRTTTDNIASLIPPDGVLDYPSEWLGIGGDGDHRPGALPDRRRRPLTTRINPEDELWIIVQPDQADRVHHEAEPRTGSLIAFPPAPDDHTSQDEFIPIPLEHTAVTASVSGYVASVGVKQRFHNPFSSKIEAVYVFPLPESAAVNGFVMTVGERTIRGIIKKREEAERIYANARARGHTASLMTQERPNIFTQKVANIEPGKRIDIDITYFHTLDYHDGWFEYAFPMVVGPRFNPPSTVRDGDAILASPRGMHPDTSQDADITYLAPHERSGHDISLNLTINAGVPIEAIDSRNHRVDATELSTGTLRITLAPDDTIPNKDFVFRYKVAAADARQGLVLQPDADGQGGYFTLLLIPPAELTTLERTPMEMVFVLDCSGSMSGQPLAQSKEAIDHALGQLRPEDTFQVIRFSDNASTFGDDPVPATSRNISRARRYVAGLRGSGGTKMINGIKQALDFPTDRERLRVVTFLTDGYIGNEPQILDAVEDHLGRARVFSFGVGSSPNRFLMNRMATIGRGAAAYLDLHHDAAPTMDLFFDRVSKAALTDVDIDFAGMRAKDVYPKRIPDLFVGRPIVLTGRFERPLAELDGAPIRITGRQAGRRVEFTHYVDVDAAHASSGLDAVWARTRIKELANKAFAGNNPDRYDREIERLALDHNLMSKYTGFVAVDSLTVTDGSYGTSVGVPVSMPEGVRYETTVGNTREPHNHQHFRD